MIKLITNGDKAMKEISFKNKFGDTLFGNSWEIENPKKILLLVTGMAENSARYDDFATFLNQNGIAVYCLDHYGQGLGKNGELGHVVEDYFFKMQDTMLQYVGVLKKQYKDKPIYLFAHSMGSFVTQGYIEKYSSSIDKVVLCGTNGRNPLVKAGSLFTKLFIHKNNFHKSAGFIHTLSIGAYEKTVKGAKSNNAWISFNEENVEIYDKDEFSGYRPTNGFYKEFMKGLSSIQKTSNIKGIEKTLPILIIGGDSDAVSSNGKGLVKLNELYLKNGLNSRVIVYKNMRHEILNEKDNMKVYKDVLNFFNE